jgi:hypothetical protein
MKKSFKYLVVAASLVLFSCGNGKKDFAENAASISALEAELKSEFGDDAYYTSISIVGTDYGSILSVTETSDPSSLKMADWTYGNGAWTQSSEITLELSGGKAEDYMFKIGDKINFETLGKIVDDAKSILKKEKEIDAKVSTILINAPDNGDFSSMEYFLNLEPATGGTTFRFEYTLEGELIKYDY